MKFISLSLTVFLITVINYGTAKLRVQGCRRCESLWQAHALLLWWQVTKPPAIYALRDRVGPARGVRGDPMHRFAFLGRARSLGDRYFRIMKAYEIA